MIEFGVDYLVPINLSLVADLVVVGIGAVLHFEFFVWLSLYWIR